MYSRPNVAHQAAMLSLVLLAHLALLYGLRGNVWIRHAVLPGADKILYLEWRNVPTARAAMPALASTRPATPTRVRLRDQTIRPTAPDPSAPRNEPTPIETVTASDAPLPGVRLDLDALRGAAREFERGRKPSEIERMQASHRRDSGFEQQFGEGVKKAQRADCRKAFSGLGLLAVAPLALSAVADVGCKW